MKTLRSIIMAAAVCALAVVGSGCATVATHYKVRERYTREAARSIARTGSPTIVVDGKAENIDEVGFWALFFDNWKDYGQGLLLDAVTGAAAAWYIHERNDDNHSTTVYNQTFNTYSGTDSSTTAGADATSGE